MTDLLKDKLDDRLWAKPEAGWSWWQRTAQRAAQYAFVLAREVAGGQLSMRAMSMVYTTLLSLVPLLALSFSMLKALGVQDTMEPVLLRMLAPLGEQADEIAATLIGFADNIRVGVLGAAGILLLFYTAISMLQKVEASFNHVWKIERPRRLVQRFGDYLSVLIVGPVLVFSSLGVTASLANNAVVNELASYQAVGFALYLAGRLVPYLMIVAAFTFLYAFVPNTRVRFPAALGGGLFAGFLWQSASILFAEFVSGATNYNAVYSSFAILLFLLLWLYVGWLILLLGCQLSYHLHYPDTVRRRTAENYVGNRSREYAALLIMGLVANRFVRGEPPLKTEALAQASGEPPEVISGVADRLIKAGLLAETDQAPNALLPARDLSAIALDDVLDVVRDDYLDSINVMDRSTPFPAVHAALQDLEGGMAKALDGRSLRDLVDAPPEPDATPS